jgi:protein-S-isoprenylcysteine O-methyltransferase Ste14
VLLVLLFVAFCGLQLARAHLEEAALEASLPDYRAYRQRSWCLAPGLY